MAFPPPPPRNRPSAVRDFPSSPSHNPTAVLPRLVFSHETTAFHNYPPNSAAQRPTASRTYPPLCGPTRRRLHGTIPGLWLEFLLVGEMVDPTPLPAPGGAGEDDHSMSTPSERDDAGDEDLMSSASESDDAADDEDLMSATESDDAGDEDLDDLMFSTEIGEYLIADGLPEKVVARFMQTMTCEEAASDGGDAGLCAVCQDDLCREDRTDVGVLRCLHRFHADCIGEWLQIKKVCPLCKAVPLEFL